MVPREWELRLLEAKRVGTYRLAIELLYLHWRGKGTASHRLRHGGESCEAAPFGQNGMHLQSWSGLG